MAGYRAGYGRGFVDGEFYTAPPTPDAPPDANPDPTAGDSGNPTPSSGGYGYEGGGYGGDTSGSGYGSSGSGYGSGYGSSSTGDTSGSGYGYGNTTSGSGYGNDASSGSGYGNDSGNSDNNGASSDGSTTDPGTAGDSDESTNPDFNGAGSWYYFSYDSALELELGAQQYGDGDFVSYIPATFWYPIGYDYPRLDVAEGKPYDALSYFHRTEHDPLFYQTLPFAAGYKDGYWDAFFNNAYGQGYTFSPDAWQDQAFTFYGADAVGPYAQWLGAYEQHYTQPTSGTQFNQDFPVKLGAALLQVPELRDKLNDPAYFAQLIALGGVYASLRTELNQDLPDFGPTGFFSAVAGAKSGADLTAAANQLSQFMQNGGDPLKLTSFQCRLIVAAQQLPALQDQMTAPDLIKALLELGSDYAALAPSDTSSDETEQPGTGNNSSTAGGNAGSGASADLTGTDSGTGMGTPDGNGTGADPTELGDDTDFSSTDDADTDANSTETDASGDTDSNYDGTDSTGTDSGDGHDTSPSDGSGNDSDPNTQGEENNLVDPDNKEKGLPPNGDNDPPDYTVKVVDGGIQFIDQYGHVYGNTTFTPQMPPIARDTSGNATPIIILRGGQILQIPARTVLSGTVVQDGDSIYFPRTKEVVSPVSLTYTTQPQPIISELTPVITGVLRFFKPLGEFLTGAVYQWLHDISAPTRWLLKLLNPYEGKADEDVEQALKMPL